VFVERLWRSVKYEEVYLRAYDSVSEARTSIVKAGRSHYVRTHRHASLQVYAWAVCENAKRPTTFV
jgi:putative transposase